jgi:hypothetical protein
MAPLKYGLGGSFLGTIPPLFVAVRRTGRFLQAFSMSKGDESAQFPQKLHIDMVDSGFVLTGMSQQGMRFSQTAELDDSAVAKLLVVEILPVDLSGELLS